MDSCTINAPILLRLMSYKERMESADEEFLSDYEIEFVITYHLRKDVPAYSDVRGNVL